MSEVLGKAAHVSQSDGPTRLAAHRGDPLHCQIIRDGLSTAGFHESDELRQSFCRTVIFVFQPLAHADVALKRGAKPAHWTPPGQGRLSFTQLLNIELGIDSCTVDASMAEQLADLGKAGARPQKVGRKAVAEKMGTVMRIAVNACPIECLLRDHRDGAAGGKAHMRGKRSQENSPTCRGWAPMPDISHDRCSDVVTAA